MKARVTVMLKDGVLDPQGAAIAAALARQGFAGVGAVRQGKVIEIDIAAPDRAEAAAQAARMCESLLANPVIEDYRVDIL
jgi:phosphoribosylformylglycinamidine synthase subunit PurS